MSKVVAFFDFDGTLTHRDSLLPFLHEVAGTPRFLSNMIALSPILIGYASGSIRNDVAKQSVLKRFLAGSSMAALREQGEHFAHSILPHMLRPAGMERLAWHQQSGHTCVLVSASVDIYLEPWARANAFDHWLTSRLEIQDGDKASGKLLGYNCYGDEKVHRIRSWLGESKPDCMFAYGDSLGDMSMLQMVDYGYLFKKNKFIKINC